MREVLKDNRLSFKYYLLTESGETVNCELLTDSGKSAECGVLRVGRLYSVGY